MILYQPFGGDEMVRLYYAKSRLNTPRFASPIKCELLEIKEKDHALVSSGLVVGPME